MTDYLKRTWAVVDMDAVAHNALEIKRRLSPSCLLMCVVKADAYGHGEKYTAHALVEAGADWFGVSSLDEAVSLREQGIEKPVLIFGITPPERAEALAGRRLTQTVHSETYASALSAAAEKAGVTLDIHIKADTGMSRLGFDASEDMLEDTAAGILRAVKRPRLNPGGIYTHFACADELNPDSAAYTEKQFERFCRLITAISDMGFIFPIRHCCNSAAAMLHEKMHMDMVRPGVALYGLSPSQDCRGVLCLKPAMSLYSAISMVKELKAGVPVSYGRQYIPERDIRVATVPIGYADGFSRVLSGRARMLVRGRFARVIGRVCMDQLMLDVTEIPGVAENDLVTAVGRDGDNEITFDELAVLSGTINYERVCAVGKRVPRVYRRGSADVGVMDYNSGAKIPEL